MTSSTRRILLLVSCLVAVYFFVPALLLRFALDRFMFPLVDGGVTHEDRLLDVPIAAGRFVRIRQYGGHELPHCVIFFPGQHGGISTYEQTLFPNITKLGIAVFALSYPGQDGARGRSYSAMLTEDVDTALATINHETSCQPGKAVYVGRSLGSAVALLAAQRVRPKGLLLDGIGSTLTTVIKAALRRHIATWPWTLLPVQSLVKNDFQLLPIINSLRPTPIVIFQGMEDQVTPFGETQSTVVGLDNVQFFAIPGAAHTHAYLLAMPQYLKKLLELVGSESGQSLRNEYGDMLEEGILDPTKVTRLALQNAASVAGLLLTTEVMIADAPKDEAEHAHMPAGGGMGNNGPVSDSAYLFIDRYERPR